jgi:hypothetical protein
LILPRFSPYVTMIKSLMIALQFLDNRSFCHFQPDSVSYFQMQLKEMSDRKRWSQNTVHTILRSSFKYTFMSILRVGSFLSCIFAISGTL